jgi:hypothetical protein
MKFFELEFSRRPRVPRPAAVVIAASLLALAAGAWQYARAAHELDALRAEAGHLRARLLAGEPPPPRPVTLPAEQVRAINRAVASLNTPWEPLLRAVEASRPASANLTHVEARAADKTLVITAQAKDIGTLLDFMAELSHADPFVDVLPVHQEVAAEDAQNRQATFDARWKDTK